MSPISRSSPLRDQSAAESTGGEYLAYGLVAEQVDRCLAASKPIDVSEIIAAYPNLEQQIRELVPALAAMHELGPNRSRNVTRDDSQPQTMLGDFVIGREIGRGGMGVVYEAEQASLGRRVALKVLPFAAVLDQRQLQRFKNEAQAAAALHHQNIVPVFAVGCERGVHYYAMLYIEGHDLAAAIEQLRKLCAEPPSNATDTETQDCATTSTGGFSRGRDFFRTVANLGIQAAEALEFAHQRGIVHRDIKPSNLMLDADGKLWVTDFGLARIETDMSLTGTGDMVGTLRYMSPEQVLGKTDSVDHRSDVYALGSTLYELATLEPVFSAENRQDLLRQRTMHEPKPLRQLDKAIPRDLETIILKSLSRRPDDRYASAQAMAEDLQRFLNGQPIAAQPPTALEQFSYWSRRNRHISWTVGASVMAVLVFIAGLALAPRWRESEQSVVDAAPQSEQPNAEAIEKAIPQESPAPSIVEKSADEKQPPAQENEDKQIKTAQTQNASSAEEPPSSTSDEPEKPFTAEVPQTQQPPQTDPIPAQDPPKFALPAETPPPEPTFVVSSDRDEYLSFVEKLLSEGLGQSGSSAIQAAEQHAAAARRLNDTDPRLNYALGLVLLKNFRSGEALKQFQAAQQRTAYPYFPAAQAEIWYLLSRKDYDAGLDRMTEMAKQIGDSPAAWPDEPTRAVAAHWLGRVVGFLTGPDNSRTTETALQQPGRDYREILSDPYRPAYDVGMALTFTTHKQLEADLGELRKASQTAQLDKRSDEKEEIAERLELVEGQQEELQLTAQQWKEWLDEQTAQADEILGKLEKEYITLDEQGKSLQRSMRALEYEIRVLTQLSNPEYSNRTDPATRLINRNDADRELLLRNDQLLRYQSQYNALDRQAGLVNQHARKTFAERQAAVQRYQKETGKIVDEKQKIQKWTKRLERRELRLKRKPMGRSSELTAATRSVKSLRSYVDIDWDAEHQRIMKSYATNPAKIASPSGTKSNKD